MEAILTSIATCFDGRGKAATGPTPFILDEQDISANVSALKKIVNDGEKDGVNKQEVDEAVKALEDWKVNARAALEKALSAEATSRDEMQAVLRGAEVIGLEEAELAECRKAIHLAEEEAKQKAKREAARHAITNAIKSNVLAEMQAALKEGQDAGLEELELDNCEVAIAAAKVEEAARSEAEAAEEEKQMAKKVSEKEDHLEEVGRQRSLSSYIFGDPKYEATVQEAEQAKEKLQAAQEKRRSSLSNLMTEQAQLDALAQEKGMPSPRAIAVA